MEENQTHTENTGQMVLGGFKSVFMKKEAHLVAACASCLQEYYTRATSCNAESYAGVSHLDNT